MAQLLRKLRRTVLNEDPSFCDMFTDERARRAGEEYLRHIRQAMQEQFGLRRLTILDAGCQAGRLLIPLAQDGHQLIGVDRSGFALRRARHHAATHGVRARVYRGDIGELRRWIAPASVDVVCCLEVLYLCPDYERLLGLLADTVKPGGLLCVSHRPTVYYVVSALRHHQPDQAAEALRRSDGSSSAGGYHNWHTPEQLTRLYDGLGLRVLRCQPVDDETNTCETSLASQEVLRALAPFHVRDSTFRFPSYWLVIAQRSFPGGNVDKI